MALAEDFALVDSFFGLPRSLGRGVSHTGFFFAFTSPPFFIPKLAPGRIPAICPLTPTLLFVAGEGEGPGEIIRAGGVGIPVAGPPPGGGATGKRLPVVPTVFVAGEGPGEIIRAGGVGIPGDALTPGGGVTGKRPPMVPTGAAFFTGIGAGLSIFPATGRSLLYVVLPPGPPGNPTTGAAFFTGMGAAFFTGMGAAFLTAALIILPPNFFTGFFISLLLHLNGYFFFPPLVAILDFIAPPPAIIFALTAPPFFIATGVRPACAAALAAR